MQREYDVIVAGAGIVGAAIAYGLAGYDKRVLMLDGADTDYRAAKANFGLVWVQGKGYRYPEYHRLSAAAAAGARGHCGHGGLPLQWPEGEPGWVPRLRCRMLENSSMKVSWWLATRSMSRAKRL